MSLLNEWHPNLAINTICQTVAHKGMVAELPIKDGNPLVSAFYNL